MRTLLEITMGVVLGFLAGILSAVAVVSFVHGKTQGTARRCAKEFTQYMIVSDNAILWFISISYVVLAGYSIYRNYTGALPWLTSGQALAFGGWATVQCFLIKKSEKQNTKGGITYDTAMREQDRLTTTEERTNLHI